MAVFAPMPSASVSTATVVKPGFFSSWRKANLRLFMVSCQWSVVRYQLLKGKGALLRDMYVAAESREFQCAVAGGAGERAGHPVVAGRLQRQRQLRVEAAAEALEADVALGGVRQTHANTAAEGLRGQARRATRGGGVNGDVAGKCLQPLGTDDPLYVEIAAEDVDVKVCASRHSDLERRLHHVVVVMLPARVALVRVDRDGRARGLDVERDVIEPIPFGAPDRLDHEVLPGSAGDMHVAGEVVKLERPA